MYTADKRLYLNEDRTKVVEEGSPEARFLLAGEGGSIPDEDAKRYGLTGDKKAAPHPTEGVPVPSTAADPEPPKSKAVPAPPENKAQTMPKASKDKDDDD